MRLQRWMTFFLPAFLILLPFVMLGFRSDLEKKHDSVPTQLRERLDANAQLLQQMSRLEFWVEESARRFKKSISRDRSPLSNWPREKTLSVALKRSRIGKIPPAMFWLVRFPEFPEKSRSQLVENPGLESQSATLIRNLLEQSWLGESNQVDVLDSPRWCATIKNLFGIFITPEFFRAKFRGRAFPVVFQGKHRLFLWDFIATPGQAGKLRSGFAMCVEAPGNGLSSVILSTILEEWPHKDVLPTFLSFPFEAGGARVRRLCHPNLSKSESAKVLAEVQREMRLTLPTDENHIIGDIHLPFRSVGNTRLVNSLGYQVVPLAPFIDSCGVLMARIPPVSSGWAGRIPMIYGLAASLMLFLYFFRWWCLGHAPHLLVGERLFSWLLGLILAPWLLAMVVGSQFLGDLKENLIDRETQTLETSLTQWDSGIGSLLGAGEKACREALAAPGLVERLKEVQLKGKDADPPILEVVDRARARGLRLLKVMVMGHGGFRKSWTKSGIPTTESDLLSDFIEVGYGKRFNEYPSPSPAIPNVEYKPKFKTAIARRASLPNTLLNYESVDRFWAGDKAHSCYVWRGFSEHKVWFLVILVWDQSSENLRYLSKQLQLENARQKEVKYAAFQKTDQGLALIDGSMRMPEFASFARKGKVLRKSWVMGTGADASLVLTLPSQRMPGAVYLARTSLRGVWIRLIQEMVIFLVLLFGSIGLVAGTAIMLSRHIAGPIVRISRSLNRISQGYLDQQLSIDAGRWDELGAAERELETLTGKLRERRALLSFVSPQVLENLSGGNLRELARGHSREATVLASDIRDFTTITESCEPREVFQLVNLHLQKMAEVIHHHGGVIDRFVGDAVFAVFYSGAIRNHVVSALESARAMMAAHSDLVSQRVRDGLLPYRIGIGIETGRLLTGILGDSESRLDFTVLGENVNRAAELENASKGGRYSRIVVSDEIRDQLAAAASFSPIDGVSGAWELIEEDLSLAVPSEPSFNQDSSEETLKADSSAGTEEEPGPTLPREKAVVPLPETGKAFSRAMVFTIFLLVSLSLGIAFFSWRERNHGIELSRARQMLQRASNQISGERILAHEIRQALHEVTPALSTTGTSGLRQIDQFKERLRELFASSPNWQYSLSLFPPLVSSYSLECGILDDSGTVRPFVESEWKPKRFGNRSLEYSLFPATHGMRIETSGAGLGMEPDPSIAFFRPSVANSTICFRFFAPDAAEPFSQCGLILHTQDDAATSTFQVGLLPSGEIYLHFTSVEINSSMANMPPRPFSYADLKIQRNDRKARFSVSYDGGQWENVFTVPIGAEFLWETGPFFMPRLSPDAVGIDMKHIVSDSRTQSQTLRFYSDDEVNKFTALAQAFFLRRYAENIWLSHSLDEWKRSLFEMRGFKSREFTEVFGRCTNTISWEVNVNKTVGMGCFPIFSPDSTDVNPLSIASTAAELNDESALIQRLAKTRKNLTGLLMVFFDPQAAQIQHLLPLLVDDFRAEGFELEVLREGDGNEPLCRNQVFQDDSYLKLVLSASQTPVLESGPWLVVQEVIHKESSYRVILARNSRLGVGKTKAGHPPHSKFEGAESWLWSPYFWLSYLIGILPLLWIWRSGIRRFFRTSSLPLRHQLLAHFLVAVLPVLFLVWQMLERARHEGEGRLLSRARTELQEKVERVDASVSLFGGYTSSLIEHELKQASATEQMQTNPARWAKHSSLVVKRLQERGLYIIDYALFHRDHGAMRYPIITNKEEFSRNTVVQRFAFRDVCRRVSPDLIQAGIGTKDEAGVSEDLILGAELDELLKGVGIGLDPATLAGLLLSPSFMTNWLAGQGDLRTLAKRVLWENGVPTLEAHFSWQTPNPEVPVFSSWLRQGEVDENGIWLLPLRVTDSQTRLVAPFILRPKAYRGSLAEIRWVVRDLNLEQQNFASLVARSGQPFLEVRGEGDQTRMRIGAPMVLLPKTMLLAEYPLGKTLAEHRRGYHLQELGLLGMMFLALLLARRAANRFLEPISILRSALLKVQEGDFSQKLPESWGAEFDTLARSFNAMTVSAEEGRILGKFVSGSALAVLGSGKISEEAKSGTQQNAVVVFVQLAGFKDLLKKRHPEWVVENLNRYFEVLSRIIRSQGGEIDKFIGDKILAVFRDEGESGNGMLKNRFRRSIEAARAMRAEYQSLAQVMGLSVGIGIVSGPVLAGIMGTPSVRLEFTVIGDTVNLASRLCDVASHLPEGGVVVEQALVQALRDDSDWKGEFQPLAVRTVKGKKREVEVFELK